MAGARFASKTLFLKRMTHGTGIVLFVPSARGGSIPRDRALMQVIRELVPHWANLAIHESSPEPRGASVVLARDCGHYTASQYFPGIEIGTIHQGFRCENLERQTFADEAFDLVVSQDVMEHVFHPELAYREVWRTLKRGGLYIHTAPIYKDRVSTLCRATISDGKVTHLAEPEYHGNPIDPNGSLVTFHYGYDLADKIAQWTPFEVEIRRFNQRHLGIVAEFTEVIICKKLL